MRQQRVIAGRVVAVLALGAASVATAQTVPSLHSNTGAPPPPPPPPPAPPPPAPPAPSDYVVYFGFDQSAVTPEARAVLQKAAQAVAVGPTLSASYRSQMAAYEATIYGNSPPPADASAAKDLYTAKEAVVGYTDTSGSAAYNTALSERRAKATADSLVSLGVPQASISVSWKGKDDPAVQTGDGVKEPLNRRATIHVEF
jgi:outer membrane protein OmpA-like peptidoglycan-associated protein